MKKTRIALVLAFVLLLSSLTSAQTLEIVLQGFNSAREVLENDLIPAFEAQHPGVTVEIQYRGWTGYADYYVSRHLGGIPPDIITLGSEELGSFAQQGLLLNIDDFLADWEGYDDVVPPAWDGVYYEDSAYALPFKLGVRTLTYRADLFEEAGLSSERPPTNWEELTEYAKRLVQKDHEGRITRQGFTVQADWKFVIPFLFQAGLDVWSPDGTSDLNSPEGIEALEYLNSFLNEDGSASLFSGSLMNSFVQGNTAMMWATSAVMDIAHGDTILETDTLGVSLPPMGHVQTTQMHIDRFAISSQSKHPELAWEWLAFLMEPESQSKLASATKFLAPSMSTIQLPPFSDDHRWMTWLESALISRPIPDHIPTWSPMLAEVLQPMLNDVLRNGTPVPSALAEFDRQIEARFGK